jgi:hypothetical protein
MQIPAGRLVGLPIIAPQPMLAPHDAPLLSVKSLPLKGLGALFRTSRGNFCTLLGVDGVNPEWPLVKV